MKTILSLSFFIVLAFFSQAQLAIGTTTTTSSSVIDFGTEFRGMVIGPSNAVRLSNAQTVGGTICFDQVSGSFRMYDGLLWSPPVSGGVTGGVQAGVDKYQHIIGATTSITNRLPTNGVLILGKDTGETKALVLPKLHNASRFFKDLVPGLIYYDTATKKVMVYNGNAWIDY